MLTEKLYDKDAYLMEFTGSVCSCNKTKQGYEVILDQTCFFPESGGQTGDKGYLNEIKVEDVKEVEGQIIHYTQSPIGMSEKVKGQVDFKERFSNMQQHSGEHILSGLIYRSYGFENVGFHLSPQTVTMDVGGELTPEQLEEIVRAANRIIFENVKISGRYPSQEELEELKYRSKKEIDGPIRIVTIEGYDDCACCAPHVSRTGEIGTIKILRAESYKGGMRLYIAAGQRALIDTLEKQKLLDRIGKKYSTNPEQLEDTVDQMKEEIENLHKQVNDLKEQIIVGKVQQIANWDGTVLQFETNMDPLTQRNYVNLLLEKSRGICGVFVGEEEQYRYIIAAEKFDVRQINAKLKELCNAKGGGSEKMVQGTLQALPEQIKKIFREF
ncbi:MAG: alanine--tRNA ligase-related protein [Lachnospiraceae bacterium]